MKTQVRMLKVKVKSLAAEARIIRVEERRAGKDDRLRCLLHEHRVTDVRREQRASLLAYAFLRGRPRAAVEPKSDPKNPPDMQRVAKLVEKFGTVDYSARAGQADAFRAWVAAAGVGV